MFAAFAMSLSSFCVVTNALRLNLLKIYQTPRQDEKSSGRENHQEKKTGGVSMTKTMKIEGMMCGHCEARVKKALEALEAVDEAVVSHENGTAVVTLSGEIDGEVLKKAVEEQDYKVLSVE
jgi:Cu2+-exporting ATPase